MTKHYWLHKPGSDMFHIVEKDKYGHLHWQAACNSTEVRSDKQWWTTGDANKYCAHCNKIVKTYSGVVGRYCHKDDVPPRPVPEEKKPVPPNDEHCGTCSDYCRVERGGDILRQCSRTLGEMERCLAGDVKSDEKCVTCFHYVWGSCDLTPLSWQECSLNELRYWVLSKEKKKMTRKKKEEPSDAGAVGDKEAWLTERVMELVGGMYAMTDTGETLEDERLATLREWVEETLEHLVELTELEEGTTE